MPTIGKEQGMKMLEKTKLAMEELEQHLYLTNPETLIVISPHGEILPDAVSLNMNSKYVTNFEEFGDLTTKMEWKPNMMLVEELHHRMEDVPFVVTTMENLDYGAAVPLYYLTQHLPKVKVLPFMTSDLDMKTHYEIGKALKQAAMGANDRVAIIASAELSQRVGENSPSGFSPKGVEFDEKIQELIKNKNGIGILDIDQAWIDEAEACGAKVLAMLFGILDEMEYKSEILSYERPIGIGYLVASLRPK
jgi:AmmeMemoRadiSam system protein B